MRFRNKLICVLVVFFFPGNLKCISKRENCKCKVQIWTETFLFFYKFYHFLASFRLVYFSSYANRMRTYYNRYNSMKNQLFVWYDRTVTVWRENNGEKLWSISNYIDLCFTSTDLSFSLVCSFLLIFYFSFQLHSYKGKVSDDDFTWQQCKMRVKVFK